MRAFAGAVALGVDGLEIDIHATRDGILMVSHDDIVDRVSDGQGAIKEMTLAELQELDFGYRWTADNGQTFPFRGQSITMPTLEELLATYPDIWINVDIKQTDPPIVNKFVQMIERFGIATHLCVGSFDHKTIKAFRRLCPTAAKAATANEARLLYVLSRIRLAGIYWGQADALQIPEQSENLQIVSEQFVRDAHRNHTAVHVWTVDDVDKMAHLIAIGVDGLITDYPDRLLRLLGRLA